MDDRLFFIYLLDNNINQIEQKYPNSEYINKLKRIKREENQKIAFEKNKHSKELIENYRIESNYVNIFRPIAINKSVFFLDK